MLRQSENNIIERLVKSEKKHESINDWLSNMDPRDASESKILFSTGSVRDNLVVAWNHVIHEHP